MYAYEPPITRNHRRGAECAHRRREPMRIDREYAALLERAIDTGGAAVVPLPVLTDGEPAGWSPLAAYHVGRDEFWLLAKHLCTAASKGYAVAITKRLPAHYVLTFYVERQEPTPAQPQPGLAHIAVRPAERPDAVVIPAPPKGAGGRA